MIVESVPISVEYHIVTTSDWTKFQIKWGGWWSNWKVDCLKGCDKLKQRVGVDDNTITIAKASNDTTLVEVRIRCVLNINKKWLDSDISYLITKGDLKSTTVRIIVQGKEIESKTNPLKTPKNPKNPMSFNVPADLHVSASKERRIEIDYGDLEKRVKKFKKYERIFNSLTGWWFIGLFLVPVGEYIIRYFFGRKAETWEQMIFIAIGMAIVIGFAYLTGKRMNKYRLEDNEWATFYTHSIINNLQKYSKTTNIELKKDHRKKAVENAKDFLSCIKKRWKIGSFKLAQNYFGKSLSELKKNIEYRVIPFLKDGDDNLLRKIEQVMRNFLAESRSLNLEGINSLNKQMSSGLPTAESMKVGFRDRLLSFFGAHRILKHGVFALTVFVGCCVFYYTLVNYLQIVKEYALTVSVASFLGLVTIYFRRQPKE